jgi:hypothetical protein
MLTTNCSDALNEGSDHDGFDAGLGASKFPEPGGFAPTFGSFRKASVSVSATAIFCASPVRFAFFKAEKN